MSVVIRNLQWMDLTLSDFATLENNHTSTTDNL